MVSSEPGVAWVHLVSPGDLVIVVEPAG